MVFFPNSFILKSGELIAFDLNDFLKLDNFSRLFESETALLINPTFEIIKLNKTFTIIIIAI